jgi:hypothetical protein
MKGENFFKIFFQHSTTSLNDVPSRKGGTFATPCIKIVTSVQIICCGQVGLSLLNARPLFLHFLQTRRIPVKDLTIYFYL